ncbi:TPA: hypothetical protein ACFNMU_002002 [Neisseria lactamica]|uniref:hypothetical protein n=1 Tax=Neisseria meningitidis TaxID=487 RepID=UPI00030E0966|nr:hypothetical protein [Neisseria meningitidis]
MPSETFRRHFQNTRPRPAAQKAALSNRRQPPYNTQANPKPCPIAGRNPAAEDRISNHISKVSAL